RTGHRPRGQVGNRAHCDLLCHASLQSAADGPWHVIVHLPSASCGATRWPLLTDGQGATSEHAVSRNRPELHAGFDQESSLMYCCRLPGSWDHWFAMRMGPVGL